MAKRDRKLPAERDSPSKERKAAAYIDNRPMKIANRAAVLGGGGGGGQAWHISCKASAAT